MFNGLCHLGNWGSLAPFGGGGWIGWILSLAVWVGLIGGLTVFVVWALRRGQTHSATGLPATRQPTAKEILQAQYARGEITREQYELRKHDLG